LEKWQSCPKKIYSITIKATQSSIKFVNLNNCSILFVVMIACQDFLQEFFYSECVRIAYLFLCIFINTPSFYSIFKFEKLYLVCLDFQHYLWVYLWWANIWMLNELSRLTKQQRPRNNHHRPSVSSWCILGTHVLAIRGVVDKAQMSLLVPQNANTNWIFYAIPNWSVLWQSSMSSLYRDYELVAYLSVWRVCAYEIKYQV
jgi:hypothetical protein